MLIIIINEVAVFSVFSQKHIQIKTQNDGRIKMMNNVPVKCYASEVVSSF